jgi:hypothetical protein
MLETPMSLMLGLLIWVGDKEDSVIIKFWAGYTEIREMPLSEIKYELISGAAPLMTITEF